VSADEASFFVRRALLPPFSVFEFPEETQKRTRDALKKTRTNAEDARATTTS